MRTLLPVPLAALMLAQQSVDPTSRLVRAREILVERSRHLPDYTCVQTVDRQYFIRPGAHSPQGLAPQSTDRLRLEIKDSHGSEIGSWPGSHFSSRNIFDLIGGGPYGTGMLGEILSDIFVNGGATYQYVGDRTAAAATLSVYRFQVPLAASHYQVRAGEDWAVTAFSGQFWLESDSANLRRLRVQADPLPPETGESAAQTEVEYQTMKVGTGDFLLPLRSPMHLVMRNEAESRNTAVYSDGHEYHSEATIRFDQTASAAPPPLPKGLPISVALAEPVDTDNAAAGDIVRAKVRKSVRDPRLKTVLVPAGAVVLGRIILMRHWLLEPRNFKIAIVLETLVTGGISRPLYARFQPGNPAVQSVGQSPTVAEFTFSTASQRYRVPAGYESNWVTVDPPAEDDK